MARRKKKNEGSLGGFILLFVIGWMIVKCSSSDDKKEKPINNKPVPLAEIPQQQSAPPPRQQMTAEQKKAMEQSEAEAYAKIRQFTTQHGLNKERPLPRSSPFVPSPEEQRQKAQQAARERIKAEERAWHSKYPNPTRDTSSYSSSYSYSSPSYSNSSGGSSGMVYVHPYTRKDGTQVSGYYRHKR